MKCRGDGSNSMLFHSVGGIVGLWPYSQWFSGTDNCTGVIANSGSHKVGQLKLVT